MSSVPLITYMAHLMFTFLDTSKVMNNQEDEA